MRNAAADAWASAQSTARDRADGLELGDYLYRWDDDPEDELSEMVTDEVRRTLRGRGLRLDSDDCGLRVARAEEES